MKIIQTKVMRKVDEDYLIVRHNPVRYEPKNKNWSRYKEWKFDRRHDREMRVWSTKG